MPPIKITTESLSPNGGAGTAVMPHFPERFPFPGRVLDAGFLPLPGRDNKDENNKREHEPDYKPELICRTFVGDDGTRPLISSIHFWESPDIWVVAPDSTDIPMAGVVNQVKVHVWNQGLAPAYGTQVELYWCNPSVGVNLANATQIGTPQTTSLAAKEHKILTFAWTPEFVNGGHECLVAQVYDPVTDNLVAPFNPLQDRHVAQRNINQIHVPQGQKIELDFFVANLSQLLAKVEIQIEPLQGERLQAFAQGLGHDFLPEASGARTAIMNVQVKAARPKIDLDQHPAAAVFRETLEPIPQRLVRTLLAGALNAIPISKTTRERLPEEPTEQPRLMLQLPTDTHPTAQDVLSRTYEILPRQELTLTLTIALPENAHKGVHYAYRVLEKSEDRIIGGITYLVKVT
jgi:hypothetical protein